MQLSQEEAAGAAVETSQWKPHLFLNDNLLERELESMQRWEILSTAEFFSKRWCVTMSDWRIEMGRPFSTDFFTMESVYAV